MAAVVDVTFQEMWPSEEVLTQVNEQAGALQSAFGELGRCHVEIERPRGRKGRRYRVSVTVSSAPEVDSSAARAESEHSRLGKAVTQAFRNIGPRLRRQVLAA